MVAVVAQLIAACMPACLRIALLVPQPFPSSLSLTPAVLCLCVCLPLAAGYDKERDGPLPTLLWACEWTCAGQQKDQQKSHPMLASYECPAAVQQQAVGVLANASAPEH